MNSNFRIPNLGSPPEEYSREYMDQLIRQLSAFFNELKSQGQVRTGTLNFGDIPTDTTDLRHGDVYLSTDGQLKIIWNLTYDMSGGVSVTAATGTVSVSTP